MSVIGCVLIVIGCVLIVWGIGWVLVAHWFSEPPTSNHERRDRP